jgi:hypothetical protein
MRHGTIGSRLIVIQSRPYQDSGTLQLADEVLFENRHLYYKLNGTQKWSQMMQNKTLHPTNQCILFESSLLELPILGPYKTHFTPNLMHQ